MLIKDITPSKAGKNILNSGFSLFRPAFAANYDFTASKYLTILCDNKHLYYLKGGSVNSFLSRNTDNKLGVNHKYFSIAKAIQQYFGETDGLLSLFPLGCQSFSYTSSNFIALSR